MRHSAYMAVGLLGLFGVAVSALPPLPESESVPSVVYESVRIEMQVRADGGIDVRETLGAVLNGTPEILTRPYSGTDVGAITFSGVSENGRYYLAGNLERREMFRAEVRRDWRQWFRAVPRLSWRCREKNDPSYDRDGRTFVLEYRLDGMVADDGSDAWLYWRPLFQPEPPVVPPRMVEIVVHFPVPVGFRQVRFDIRADDARVRLGANRNTVTLVALNPVAADRAAIALRFPLGTVRSRFSPLLFYRFQVKKYALGGVALLLFLLAAALGLHYFRTPRSAVPVARRDFLDLSPALLGLLPDGQFNNRELTAMVLDLARRGVIGIRDYSAPDEAFSGDYEVTLRVDWTALPLLRHERLILEKFFPDGLARPRTVIPELSIFFYSCRDALVRAVWADAADTGWFRVTPLALRRLAGWIGGLLLAAGAGLAFSELPGLTFGLGLCLAVGVVMMFSAFKSYRNGHGFTALEALLLSGSTVIAVALTVHGSAVSEWRFDAGAAAALVGAALIALSPWLVFRSRRGEALLAGIRQETARYNPESGEAFADAELLPFAVACGLPLREYGGGTPFLVRAEYLRGIERADFDLQRFCVGIYAPWKYYYYFMNLKNYRLLHLGLVRGR